MLRVSKMKKIDELKKRVDTLGRELADSVRDFIDLKFAYQRLREKNQSLLNCVEHMSKNDPRWSGMSVEDIVEEVNGNTQD
tara:strand:- start:251 stop:493 length:243 start_codon:yes stop_codon:yes gene_type:complete